MNRTPITFHLGLHKTATSSLQSDFFIPQNGYSQNNGRSWLLPMFVNKPSTDELNEDEVNEIEIFIKNCVKENLIPIASHERLSGYPISGGYDRLSILNRIKKTNLNIRIFLVIREQKSWLYSAWKQMITDGGSLSLTEFLTPSQTAPNVRKPLPRLEYLNYAREIQNLYNMFGKENVCVLPMELINQDFESFKIKLCEFTGVPAENISLQALPRVNESKNVSALYINRVLNSFFFRTSTNEYGLCNDNSLFGLKIRRVTNKIANSCPEIPFSKNLVENHRHIIEQVVKDFYANINTETSKLINLDLKKFGYS